MPVIRLETKTVAKPWGRWSTGPWFDDVAAREEPVGEIWFELPPGSGLDDPELLVKYLFTSRRLSVQVHPDDATAKVYGLPRGKSEAWQILEAEPGASVALGLRTWVGLEMPASPFRCATIVTVLLACGNPAFAQTSTASSSSRTEGYGEQYNVPPPRGYKPSPGRFVQSDREREEDDRYSREAERWAAANCIADRRSNVAVGAVIGGLVGALAGSGLAGRYDRAPATVLGAGAGAVAGSAIARNASPDCPPGFVVKVAPEPFYPPPVYPHVYMAPPWYDPWVWYGGH